MYNFKNLEVWQKSIKMTPKTYHFTASEKFKLTSQMRPAGVSVLSNIAKNVILFFRETAQQLEIIISEIQKQTIGVKSTLTS